MLGRTGEFQYVKRRIDYRNRGKNVKCPKAVTYS